jgi:carboxymethylenebutenolidase
MPIQTSTVTFPTDTYMLSAYLARPEGDGPFPGVIVIHEIFGLSENIMDIARRFANEGYAALAVDLFAGRNRTVCMFRFMSGMLLNSLHHGGIKDLKTTLDYFSTQPFVDPQRVGAIGFCMGGGFAIGWACTDPRLKVIAPFYGSNPRPLEAARRLCPVVGSYPGADFTAAQGRKLDEYLETCNISHDIKIYPGAQHSFFNDQNPARHDPQASADAWVRTLAFFKQTLA